MSNIKIKGTTVEIEINNKTFFRATYEDGITWSCSNVKYIEKWCFNISTNIWKYEKLLMKGLESYGSIVSIPSVELEYQNYIRAEKLNRILND